LTSEFIDFLARRFGHRDVMFWRDRKDGEYAFTRTGLFPRPVADPDLYCLLGILAAKTIGINAALSVRFSEQFLRLVAGEVLTVADILDDTAKSLMVGEESDSEDAKLVGESTCQGMQSTRK
jgi:hypothetical protein